MTEIESKSLRQELAISRWIANKARGTFNFVPRFGKTRTAKLIAERTLAKRPSSNILAIGPNDITYKNLKTNLDKRVWFVTRNTIVRDYASFKEASFDLIIIDEIHRFLDKDGEQILALDAKFKLGLTGSKLSYKDKNILKEYGYEVVDIITETEALDNKWISPFVEYNLGVEIEDYKKDLYKNCTEHITSITSTYHELYKRMNTVFGNKIFNSDIDLMFGLYSGISYKPDGLARSIFIPPVAIRGELAATMGWTKDIDLSVDMNQRINQYFNPSVLQETAKMFGDIIRERNDLIINSKNKIEAVLKIIERNPVPTIIFNESTNMASLIADALGLEAIEYHSAIQSTYIKDPTSGEYVCHANGNPIKFGATRLKKYAIEGIKNGLFKYLCTAKALNEGVDIPILSQVITTGGTTNPSTHFQRVSRGKTLYEENPDKVAIIINVYIKDFTYKDEVIPSRDAAKLRIRQKDAKVYWVENIDEIFTDIE